MCVNCGCSSCNTNSYVPDNTSALKYDGPKFVCSPDFTVLPGASLNDMLNTLMQQVCANSNSLDFEHYLGEEFGGGIIYHLWRDSFGVEHGLIVNKAEQTSTTWQAVGTLTNANRTEDGVYNTALMTLSDAATYVNGLTDGGFTDWYLPSIDELSLLWHNRFHANTALRAGAFTLLSSTDTYWSSLEQDTTLAFTFSFYYGNANYTSKNGANYVRAIRSF
jgi:hypothetical protein